MELTDDGIRLAQLSHLNRPVMNRNEANTCADVIEPALTAAGWKFDGQVLIGPSRVNLTGDRMYDESCLRGRALSL